MKTCSMCGVAKPLAEFHKGKGYAGGYNSRCKPCRAGVARASYESAREEVAARSRARYRANLNTSRRLARERAMAWNRARGVKPRYYCATEEERRLGQAASKRRYAERYPEKVTAAQRAYAERNPEKVKIAVVNVKARYRGSRGELTATQWKAILLFYGHRCAQCGASADDRPLSVDHFIPISSGGANTWENVWPLCVPCNVRKGASLPEAPLPPHVETFRKTGTFD